jgi:ATP-dependent Lon protease
VPIVGVPDILLPDVVLPLTLAGDAALRALEVARERGSELHVLVHREGSAETAFEGLYRLGAVGSILNVIPLRSGDVKVLVRGAGRFRVADPVQERPYLEANVIPLIEEADDDLQTDLLLQSLRGTFRRFAEYRRLPDEIVRSVLAQESLNRIVHSLVAHLNLETPIRQRLLEVNSPGRRIEQMLNFLEAEADRLGAAQAERPAPAGAPNAIRDVRRAAGLFDSDELAELRDRLAALDMPEHARARADRELARLERMPAVSAEATVIRNYLDWIVDLPWNKWSDESTDLAAAQRILDDDHYGLEKVKERVLEYLAVKRLSSEPGGPILCLGGPPGVGKTARARSSARATGRKFVRIALGGVRDEADIRGHRRTYVGALPGRIIAALRTAGTSNPLLLLDEIDKMGFDFRGDPGSALLEVLDAEQNQAFVDHYLDLGYDLSRVMFVCTANALIQVPPTLRDRLEIIPVPGYSDAEKIEIARRYLVPKQHRKNGLPEAQLEITVPVLREILSGHTRESGVRGLERMIATICRKEARRIADLPAPLERKRVTRRSLASYLGPPPFSFRERESADRVGVCTGLAYTEVGGDILHVEVSITPGQGNLQVTGRLGEVMKESAAAAVSYIRSRAHVLGIATDFYAKVDIHIHVPEGSTPKDGPSAGITLATAIASALTRHPIRSDVAMTGEITLRGRVLTIGGLREKLLAAHRCGIRKVIIPSGNRKDLAEMAAHVRRDLELVPVEHMDEVLEHAFVNGANLDLEAASSLAFIREERPARAPDDEPAGAQALAGP